MHSKPENGNSIDSDIQPVPPATIGSHPWWRGIGYGVTPPAVLPESLPKSSSLENRNGGVESRAAPAPAPAGERADEGARVKEVQTMTTQADGSQGHERQQTRHATSTMPPAMSEYTVPHTQLELGHSVAYPYSDPYYGGIMAAYGTQALVHPHMIGLHHRMPLPLEMAEEPVYVNAKQYHGILRRRQSRAKAELEKKLVKVRKPYLHESRHQHALRRARGTGGRFLNTKKPSKNATSPTVGKGTHPGSSAPTQSASSSGSEPLHSDCTPGSSSVQQEVKGLQTQDMHEQHAYSNGNGFYQQHPGFPMSTFRSLPGERGDEGDCSGQQRSGMLVSQAPHRALTIK